MNISLPAAMKSFVDEQVTERGYGTSSEYVRDLIRKEQERRQLRELILTGGESEPGTAADADYFKSLRARVGAGGKRLSAKRSANVRPR